MRRIYDNIKFFLRCVSWKCYNVYHVFFKKMNKYTEEDYKNKIHELELELRNLNIYIDYLEKEIKKLQG